MSDSIQNEATEPLPKGVFHDDSWVRPWCSSEFPVEETHSERMRRFRQRPGLTSHGSRSNFFWYHVDRFNAWPWGFVIYRMAYTQISDQEWAAAIEKLDRYIEWLITRNAQESEPDSSSAKTLSLDQLIVEGYRNVVVDDPKLAAASIGDIRGRYHEWCKKHGFSIDSINGVVRMDFCLALDDRSVRSILASVEPGEAGKVGYVNMVDSSFDPEDEDNDEGKYYVGHFRIYLNNLFEFFLRTDDHWTRELGWGEYGMDEPGRVVFTDGSGYEYSTGTQDEDIFLISPREPWVTVREDLTTTALEKRHMIEQ
ncbi:hypothetical protein PENSTE_c010G08197 [Penicillium steckii]|uniref:Uncharacterized protein n=1 Tax=Penicillium steckii TaxID=303698 RepID=A0A1V6T7E0_9EURO|nr:hypothetical protein PENSTE_c010G08197 [Penicillium steckii]